MFERTEGPKEERMNALWGKGDRAGSRGAKVRTRVGVLVTLVAALALAAPMTASAEDDLYLDVAIDDVAWAEVAWADVAWAE